MPIILQTNQLSKSIDGNSLVKDVNMHVKKGLIYGFLGPNGAGKTTVLKMLTNLWKPSGGTIELFGEELTPTSYEVLKRMGSVIEFPVFYDHLSGKENLKLHCEYMGYHAPNCVENALHMLDLSGASGKSVRSYSLGMKQRLGLARAILCKPELLILDEPTNGLDPSGIKQVRELLTTLCKEYGITVLLSSHILSEIESIADTIGIIHCGSLMKEISMAEISEMGLSYIEISVTDTKYASYVLTEKLRLDSFKIMDDGVIRLYNRNITTQELTKSLPQQEVDILSITQKSETLEDYFLKITAQEEPLC